MKTFLSPARLALVALCVACGLSPLVASAQHRWTGGTSTSWNEPTNWDTGVVPNGSDEANDSYINLDGSGGESVATITDELEGDDATPRDITVGQTVNEVGGSGLLEHTSGSAVLGGGSGFGWAFIGRGAGSSGTYNLSGTAELRPGRILLGDSGKGVMNVTDEAQITLDNELWVGQAGGDGTLNMDSGAIRAGSWIAIGRDNGTGVVNLSGTALFAKTGGDAATQITIGGLGNVGGGTLNVNDNATVTSNTGMLVAESAERYGIVNQMGGTVDLVGNLEVQGDGIGEYNLSGGLLKAATVNARDAAALVPANGTFSMTGGTLAVGSFYGDLAQQGGTLAPGASPGLTLITGNYSLVSGDLDIELNGLTAISDYDQLAVTGDVSLAGDLSLSVGFSPSFGDMFTIIDNQGPNAVSGAFTQGNSISVGALKFGINYAGGDGNDVVLKLVPEPTALALASACGAAAIGLSRRRRRV